MGVAAICAGWVAVVVAARATNASSSFASTSTNILSLDWRAFLSCSSPWRRPSPSCAGRSPSGGDGVGVLRLCMVSSGERGGGGTHGMGAGGSGFGVARVGEGALGGIAGVAENSEMKKDDDFRHRSRLTVFANRYYYTGRITIYYTDRHGTDSNTNAYLVMPLYVSRYLAYPCDRRV